MNDRGYSLPDKLGVELFSNETDFRIPLDFIASTEKVEALLLSIITNRIIKTKIPGRNYINTAGNLLMSFNKNNNTFNKDADYMSDMVFTSNYKDNTLEIIDPTSWYDLDQGFSQVNSNF